MPGTEIPEVIDQRPNICGREDLIQQAMSRPGPIYLPESGIDFGNIQSAYAIALHMHQPLIPAGGDNLRTAEVISNLKDMMNHPGDGDNHNAQVFHWCYKRMGEIIPQLVAEGRRPRVMLEYSGCLLWGLRQMGLHDVFDSLKTITAPVFGFYAGSDARISATVPDTKTAMAAAGKKYDPVIYDGAGHGFMRAGEDPTNTNPANTAARTQALARLQTLLKGM